jgi:O-antigen/teichoic acid export membrane protein
LPKVIEAAKNGENTKPILFKNLIMIAGLSGAIVFGAFLFPEFAVKVLFGDAFIEIAPLLWKYALATAFFALANLFAYYFLSLNKYFPVMLSAIFGMLQIFLIVKFHQTLHQVVMMQIIAMSALLISQIIYFLYNSYNFSQIRN